MSPARLITFEGGEGAGKSTQVERLAGSMRAAGIDVLTTREPGGAPGAEEIRELLVEGEPGRWDGVTEALLHIAARREHLVKTVQPALKRGQWVISDRFADSTTAYQGYGLGLGRALIDELHRHAIGSIRPDLTILLDVPVEIGLARAAARGSGGMRYERMDIAFHRRLREGFLDIARLESERCVVIAADGDVDQIAARVEESVRKRLAPPGF